MSLAVLLIPNPPPRADGLVAVMGESMADGWLDGTKVTGPDNETEIGVILRTWITPAGLMADVAFDDPAYERLISAMSEGDYSFRPGGFE